jgi:hypothetical protein
MPEVVLFPDGHFRRAVYQIGPFIADYPEQVVLACVVQGWCPKFVLICLSCWFKLADTLLDALPYQKSSVKQGLRDFMNTIVICIGSIETNQRYYGKPSEYAIIL